MRKILTSIMVMGVLAGMPAPRLSAAESEPAPSCFAVGRNAICINEQSYTADVCAAIAAYSDHWSLPEAFFARLIWQESRFDPYAISPAGAQGIAQFMPGTARLRQLGDMFDPAEALARSAEYLRELELKYGNLGLAAAAYNAGEGRISRVVNSGAGVPLETRNFVSIITGRGIDYWLGDEAEPLDYTLHPETGFIDACIDMANSVPMPDFGPEPAGWQPWGILIAQNFSRDLATQRFERAQANYGDVLGAEPLMLISVRNANFGPRTRFSAMVGRPTRQDAQALCDSLLAIGGQCIVQRNRE